MDETSITNKIFEILQIDSKHKNIIQITNKLNITDYQNVIKIVTIYI